jgi:hypothetical protein
MLFSSEPKKILHTLKGFTGHNLRTCIIQSSKLVSDLKLDRLLSSNEDKARQVMGTTSRPWLFSSSFRGTCGFVLITGRPYYTEICRDGLRKTTKTHRIAVIRATIRTYNLPITKHECYSPERDVRSQGYCSERSWLSQYWLEESQRASVWIIDCRPRIASWTSRAQWYSVPVVVSLRVQHVFTFIPQTSWMKYC